MKRTCKRENQKKKKVKKNFVKRIFISTVRIVYIRTQRKQRWRYDKNSCSIEFFSPPSCWCIYF